MRAASVVASHGGSPPTFESAVGSTANIEYPFKMSTSPDLHTNGGGED